MANEEHLKILKQGVDVWNKWREKNPEIVPDLSKANLSGAYLREANLRRTDLYGANLSRANLRRADLSGAYLSKANLSGADLSGAYLEWANLSEANLSGGKLYEADLIGASLIGANLIRANLSGADLTWANLSGSNLSEANLYSANLFGARLSEANLNGAYFIKAQLVETNFEKAILTNCWIYGISAWGLQLKDAVQKDLVITPRGASAITVDNLEVAQFIYLLLYNEKIRHVIDTITSKVVLILGPFNPPERKAVLDTIKEELRKRDYLPVMFDFEPPRSRNLTETITTLARLSRFIIADIAEPAGSVAHELQAIVPHLESVPVQPILQTSAKEYGMFKDYKRKAHVLEIYQYDSLENLLASFNEKVIIPAEAKVKEIRKEDAKKLLKE